MWKSMGPHHVGVGTRLETNALGRGNPSGRVAKYRFRRKRIAPDSQMSLGGDPEPGPPPTAERSWLG